MSLEDYALRGRGQAKGLEDMTVHVDGSLRRWASLNPHGSGWPGSTGEVGSALDCHVVATLAAAAIYGLWTLPSIQNSIPQ